MDRELSQNIQTEFQTAIMAFTSEFQVMSLNQTARQLLGCDPFPGEIYPLDRLFDARDLTAAQQAVDQVFATGRSSQNLLGRVTNKSGRRILCRYGASPIFELESRVIGVLIDFRDVSSDAPVTTSSPIHVAGANQGHLDIHSVFEDLPEGVFTIDTQWHVTSFNQTAEQVTGFKRQEVLGKKCWEIFQSDQCRKNCPMATALKTGRTYFDQEVVTLDRRGRRRTLVVNVNAVKDKSGRLIGAVETFRVSDDFDAGKNLKSGFAGIVGRSRVLRDIFDMLPDIARSEANVLICGETGTGKDMFARAIHQLSKRKKGPFAAVNCSALAESLLESELFGHEKGAFTGADRTRPGRFEMAGDGTLFLDEIGELKPNLQVKLLRVLEQRVFERVGSLQPIPLRARLLSATNQSLEKLLAEGRFREDLYYRLKTVPITIPPLRERKEDIAPLVEHFLEKFNMRYDKKVRSVDPKVMQAFEQYHWPGNVRELERCIEHAFVFVKGPVIFQRYLPETAELNTGPKAGPGVQMGDSKDRKAILWALSRAGGRRKEAAALLGISRTSMWRRMKELEISWPNRQAS